MKTNFLQKQHEEIEHHFNQGMNKLISLFLGLLGCVLSIFFSIWVFNSTLGSPDCPAYKRIKKLEIHGKVIQKKREKATERARAPVETLFIINTKGKIKKFPCHGSFIKIYDLVDEGDSIRKSKDEFSFHLNNQAFYPYQFECDENDWHISF